MASSEVVSVIIPTKNRSLSLRQCLTAIYRQSIPVEVLVMDDGSTDDTTAVIRAEFPQVRLFTSPESKGPTYQRNLAARHSTCEIMFTIDDDCILSNPTTLHETTLLFSAPNIAAVTVPFVNVLKDTVLRTAAPDREHIYVAMDFFGGMIAFRRRPYLELGGYREVIFMYVEESDLAIRLLNAGYFIRLGSAPPIDHMESPIRNVKKNIARLVRNHMLFAVHNVPMPYLLVHLPATMFNSLRGAVREGAYLSGMQGLWNGMKALPNAFRERQAVRAKVYKLVRARRHHGPFTLDQAVSQLSRS